MNDRELLELAAKAVGVNVGARWIKETQTWFGDKETTNEFWNPLTDDGDALRLAVKLSIPFYVFHQHGTVISYGAKSKKHPEGLDAQEFFTSDPYSATRRAIVRAAAEIGKQMKE